MLKDVTPIHQNFEDSGLAPFFNVTSARAFLGVYIYYRI